MSLVSFHRLLIAVAIVFCLGFAGWETRAYLGGGGLRALTSAAVFFVLGLALVVYLARLNRILKLEDPSDRPG
jgi:hypothetical protein